MTVITKIIAFFMALMNTLLLTMGIRKIPVEQPGKDVGTVELINGNESTMSATALYAKNARNAVQAAYVTTRRKAFRMSNGQMSLTHRLEGANKTADLTDKNGKVYLSDTFKTFFTDKAGVEHVFENSVTKGRVNVIRLGEYYYDCHIRDLEKQNFRVDKNYHVYADKLYAQVSVLANKPTADLHDFGCSFTVPASSVDAISIRDGKGIHSTTDGVDASGVEYVAFDIRSVGVVGFIVPSDGSAAKVTVSKSLGVYTVKLYAAYDASLGLNDYAENGGYGLNAIRFGCRVYTDSTHSFHGVTAAAEEERHPLESITVSGGTSGAKYLGYDALRGTYTLQMNGTDFQTAYDNPQMQFTAPVSIRSDSDRVLYFRTYGTSGCLEASAILDDRDTLVPMEVEVCKNFRGDGGESFYGAKDYAYGDAFFPVAVTAGQNLKFTILHLYQNWGRFPIKQLSSIEFHISYYHLSTGTTESNCIAPYFVGNKDGWTLPDFRNRSGNIWSGQPQFNSVGILKFMQYRDNAGGTCLSELAGAKINSTGLAYSDIENTYVDDNGHYTYTLRHVEMPQTDENRTYYTMDLTFDKDMSFADFRNDMDLFYFDGRFVKFNRVCYLNSDNVAVSRDVDTSDAVKYYVLGSEQPFLGFYDVTDDTDYQIDNCFGCNFALILRDSRIVMNGEEKVIPFVFREDSTADISRCALTLDAKDITFRKGDTISLNMILLPWGTGREENCQTVSRIREDSAVKPITVTASKGTVVEDAILPVIKAENNEAVFTVKGGRNNNAVTVTGISTMAAPRIELLKDGEWTRYETASEEHGYDGYTVKIDDDGSYAFSFVYTAADPDTEYTFRLTATRG